MSENRLNPQNCNKSHCKTCIFHPNFEKRIKLQQERINEITEYLATFKSSHICHVTNKTCYGSLEFQANILFGIGIINENNVNSLLETAKNFI